MRTTFEAQLWEVYREVAGSYWLPSHRQFNHEKAGQMEALADRLEEVYANHGGDRKDVAVHIQEARRYMQGMAKALRDHPHTDQRDEDFTAMPHRLEASLRQAADAHVGLRRLPWGTNRRLDAMVNEVHKAGDLLEFGKVGQAVKTLDELLRSVRGFRDDLTRQMDRGR